MARIVVYDTEFIEDGSTIDLVSIGMVDDAGREFYAISTEFDESKASDWVRENVLTKLPPRNDPAWVSRATIRNEMLAYLSPTDDWRDLELWAYYGAYDHVALAQLWGRMIDLPRGVPMFTHELMQLWERSGRPERPTQSDKHNALDDAKYGMALWRLCMESSP